jgi:hypothetical protein
MSEHGPADEDEPQQGETPIGGGRSMRGPAVRPGGEQEPGGLVPPYEGRRETADVDDEGPPDADVNVGAATGPVRADPGLTSEEPADTPGGAHASPAEEQPADQAAETEPDEGGVDLTAHTPGVPRGEELER